MNPQLSVIICTYNRERYLGNSLACLTVQDTDPKLFELLVVNNRSTDSTKAICEKFKKEHPEINFRYLEEEKPGLSFARNKGILESKGEIIVFLDDDAMASPSFLSEILQVFYIRNDVIAGGGKIIPEYELNQPNWMTSYLLPVVSALDLGSEIRDFPRNKYPIGANMFFKKDFFSEFGLFKTGLGRKGKMLLGGEEKDVFERIKTVKGRLVYLPGAWVKHIVPSERLELNYVLNMAQGVGLSEAIRYRENGRPLLKMFFREWIKWAGSLLLFFLFLIKFQKEKAFMLIRFRYNVSRGMLRGVNYDYKNTGNSD